MDSYQAMCNEAGDEENLRHTKKDHLNYWTRLKMKNIEGGDAQAVSEITYQELANDPEFFFRFRLNKEGKLRALFWRDSMMREDYSIYGDVVVFDTTYRTNRYNLICAPIIGINNHWRNCMFGCAFIGDEKIESFVWLLETSKKSMGGKCPISIFTDQDQAMCSAIQKVFPEVRHRLCLWHLEQNAITIFGSLKRDKDFKRTFSYSLSKDFFSAGIRSSKRSESTNHAIGFRANRLTSLTDFCSIFKACIQRWRSTEKHGEFLCSKSTASSAIPLSGLLKHASEIYTLSLFTDFEEEFGYSIATTTKLLWQNGSTLFYLVNITLTFSDDSTRSVYKKEMDKTNKDIEAKTNQATEAETNQATEVETNQDTEAKTNQDTEAETNQAIEAETNQATSSSIATEAPLILDPERKTTKGRNKRPRGPMEKKRKKTAVPPLEFGAITPNLRLF
ncbi:protein FAR1-RELATED SEQUENCE 5-like [Chenopodium quinoa]|uniref:protein FAR1-RELATED SEQUENCE 5-like n=1 Tax=Chenopodium quinoa TaxID=63459 RepID=UPI000B7976DA|nr:protein FAR1-RELATED SEQUENCE 5-like [Chenopodium quinoa]